MIGALIKGLFGRWWWLTVIIALALLALGLLLLLKPAWRAKLKGAGGILWALLAFAGVVLSVALGDVLRPRRIPDLPPARDRWKEYQDEMKRRRDRNRKLPLPDRIKRFKELKEKKP